ncbi:hypothetical protein GUITHDRAFT_116226 [Guillardia theta CCMP2712]|uniref:Uncharacterized protein n=1 Tax=Guillardia theta (strain CCMP2712) TaxID=905079 RepID=L1INX0_GUITC|nr:hypothetical protein GUITHDRAFT_116226 [Guillardia theta CCMP2712]EKX37584.1 hypothetical protein GUITHDRAFT_116226 [Guillardia theta CCMP2712]|eukprot:XP_005824564.1 hypothetical protein GUITHDRAFT_116226 [Guillardia theta CCMP2712]
MPKRPGEERSDAFMAEVRGLNDQFFKWASRQHSSSSDKLWDAGLRDYLRYADKLRSDFSDVLAGAGQNDSVLEGGNIFVFGQGDNAQIACGGMHTLALCEGGAVYSWGVNDEGALGREARGGQLALTEGETQGSESIPEMVEFPNREKMTAVSAGDSHSVALSSNGTIFAWGIFRDSSGKFGFSPTVQTQTTPQQVALGLGEKCIEIASGNDHVLALTRE